MAIIDQNAFPGIWSRAVKAQLPATYVARAANLEWPFDFSQDKSMTGKQEGQRRLAAIMFTDMVGSVLSRSATRPWRWTC